MTPTSRYQPRYTPSTYVTTPQSTTAPATTAPATTTTTLAGIKGQISSAPSTVPLVTKAQSAHVDPVLAKMSLGGLALAFLIMAVQFVLTRPGRGGRWTL